MYGYIISFVRGIIFSHIIVVIKYIIVYKIFQSVCRKMSLSVPRKF